eukprot:219247-Amphidinium_carterae.1
MESVLRIKSQLMFNLVSYYTSKSTTSLRSEVVLFKLKCIFQVFWVSFSTEGLLNPSPNSNRATKKNGFYWHA